MAKKKRNDCIDFDDFKEEHLVDGVQFKIHGYDYFNEDTKKKLDNIKIGAISLGLKVYSIPERLEGHFYYEIRRYK